MAGCLCFACGMGFGRGIRRLARRGRVEDRGRLAELGGLADADTRELSDTPVMGMEELVAHVLRRDG